MTREHFWVFTIHLNLATMTVSSPLLFQPDPFLLTKMPSFRHNNVPRFLFRVHTPESYSQTSLTEVVPQASAHNAARAEQDIFTWDRRDAARILDVQLRWWLHRDASDYWDQWANRVVELRKPFSETDKGKTTEHYEVRTAIVIAERCYPGRWALPVATMLLALKPRMHNDCVILDGFASTYSGK
jgi:hypothetical protein